ncbi:hypothetical protein HOL24_02320 [bacterium]|jgi:hypothetical protein|nr:hypothetical protein [bacterium]
MIVKKYKFNASTYIAIAIAIVVTIYFTFDKKKIVLSLHDSLEYFMSTDPGFSYPRNLVDTGEEYFKNPNIYLKLKSIMNNFHEIILYKFQDNHNELENLDISIKFLNFKKILDDRKIAIKNGYLNNPSYVNATIKHNQKTYKAKIRLKGNIADHWMSKNRLSLRVQLKNGKSILGLNTFSIQKPRARQYPYEQAFQDALRRGGNLTAKYKFVTIRINGNNWGIMNLEEEISKEFLEKQRVRNSIVFRFSDDKKRLKNNVDYPAYYRISDEKLFASVSKQKKYLRNIENRKKYTYIMEKRLKKNHAEIYSKSRHIRSFIASLLWNNQHTLYNSNSKYYFNPYTLELEPITADQLNFSLYNEKLSLVLERMPITEVYNQVISSPISSHEKDKYLEDAVRLFDNIENRINQYHKYFPLDKYKKGVVLKDNIDLIYKNKVDFYEWIDNYKIKQKGAVANTDALFSESSIMLPQHLHVRHYNDGKILIFNLLPYKVKINQIVFDGSMMEYSDFIINGYKEGKYTPHVVQTGITGIQDNKIIINSTYQNNIKSTVAYPTMIQHGVDNPLLLNTVDKFDFINKLDENIYGIEQGNWVVNSPMIVDGDLQISSGANLIFSENSYIIVKGSLVAVGSESNPITLKAESDKWKGIYVLNAGKKSYLKNVNISNVTALEDELLKLTGGITFYKSDVDFENVRISDVKAEDAINIVESSFSLNSVFINNTISDGFDSDFSKGSVLHSKLSNIGGDALDFSGSNVLIENTTVINVKDKAVSAGEESVLNIENSHFDNIGVGVASKDGSLVTINNTRILDYKLYAAMSYIKKDFYSMPDISINNSSVSDGNSYIRQKGTNMTVDNIKIPESKMSVKKLYRNRVMSK